MQLRDIFDLSKNRYTLICSLKTKNLYTFPFHPENEMEVPPEWPGGRTRASRVHSEGLDRRLPAGGRATPWCAAETEPDGGLLSVSVWWMPSGHRLIHCYCRSSPGAIGTVDWYCRGRGCPLRAAGEGGFSLSRTGKTSGPLEKRWNNEKQHVLQPQKENKKTRFAETLTTELQYERETRVAETR